MKPIEIVELIKQANPKLLDKMPDEKVAKIISATLREVGKHVSAAENGALKITGLGTFKIRQVERQKNDEMVNIKKIAFTAAKVKATEES